MTFTQLEIFLALVEKLSFSEVASDLGVSQSAVSHSLASLEKEIGYPLFFRSSHKMALTEDGLVFVPFIRTIINNHLHLTQEIQSRKNIYSGKLRIGSIGPSTTVGILPKPINEYRKKYPSIKLEVLESDELTVEKWVEERFVDLGFVINNSLDLDQLVSWKDQYVGIFSKEHHFSTKKNLTAEDFAGENILLPNSGCAAIVKRFLNSGMDKQILSFSLPQLASILGLVQSGLGVSIVSQLSVKWDSGSKNNLQTLPLSPKQERSIYLVCKKKAFLSLSAQKFVQTVQQQLF
jgi:DNA-binding transcriptional LysR family regulator